MFKCLLLGDSRYLDRVGDYLIKKKIYIKKTSKKINFKLASNFDLIISYGYRHIMNKNLLKKLKRPPINLHISYLPYNRGSHPNFWSFIDRTPSGVTIHEIDDGIDTGKIVFQKKINFKPFKNKNLTFVKTYKILNKKIIQLFISKFYKIIKKNYKPKKQINKLATFHRISDLPKFMNNWDKRIYTIMKHYEKK